MPDTHTASIHGAGATGTATVRRIMIVIDDGQFARAVLDQGLAIAQQLAGEVLFFRALQEETVPLVLEPPPMVDIASEQYHHEVEQFTQHCLDDAARKARGLGLRCQGAFVWGGDAATCIAQAARDWSCDLIVIGAPDRHPVLERLFGSVVSRLIRLTCAHLIVIKSSASTSMCNPRVDLCPRTSASPANSGQAGPGVGQTNQPRSQGRS